MKNGAQKEITGTFPNLKSGACNLNVTTWPGEIDNANSGVVQIAGSQHCPTSKARRIQPAPRLIAFLSAIKVSANWAGNSKRIFSFLYRPTVLENAEQFYEILPSVLKASAVSKRKSPPTAGANQ